jgi:hypothetical protein
MWKWSKYASNGECQYSTRFSSWNGSLTTRGAKLGKGKKGQQYINFASTPSSYSNIERELPKPTRKIFVVKKGKRNVRVIWIGDCFHSLCLLRFPLFLGATTESIIRMPLCLPSILLLHFPSIFLPNCDQFPIAVEYLCRSRASILIVKKSWKCDGGRSR